MVSDWDGVHLQSHPVSSGGLREGRPGLDTRGSGSTADCLRRILCREGVPSLALWEPIWPFGRPRIWRCTRVKASGGRRAPTAGSLSSTTPSGHTSVCRSVPASPCLLLDTKPPFCQVWRPFIPYLMGLQTGDITSIDA